MVFHGPISSKKKSGIGHKRKNGSSFQRHKYAISETEAVYQPTYETNTTETTPPPQKRRACNQWRVPIGIVSHDKMVQKITMERDCLLYQNTSLQGHVEKEKAATSQLAHQKFLVAKEFRAQIIRHQEEHVFSIAQLSFQFDNNIEGAFAMAYRVTGKSLVKEEKWIKGAVYHKIKMKVERKNVKEKLEKERQG